MSNYAFEINEVSKRYKTFGINDLSLKLEKGMIMGLVGQNGAGKTTLIKLIMNIVNSDGGEITVYGHDNIKEEPTVKNLIGYIADEEYMYFNFNLEKYKRIFSMAFDNWSDDVFYKYCKRFDLPMNKKFKEYSKGMKTKAMIALALAHDPKLLIMDEPTAGLDPVARLEILDILRDFVGDGERSVLFSTHITSDLDKIADYITLIINGEIVDSMPMDMVEEKYVIVLGDKKPTDMQRNYLIGCKERENSFTALAKRADISKLGDVSVRVPDIENLLIHNILERKKGE